MELLRQEAMEAEEPTGKFCALRGLCPQNFRSSWIFLLPEEDSVLWEGKGLRSWVLLPLSWTFLG